MTGAGRGTDNVLLFENVQYIHRFRTGCVIYVKLLIQVRGPIYTRFTMLSVSPLTLGVIFSHDVISPAI